MYKLEKKKKLYRFIPVLKGIPHINQPLNRFVPILKVKFEYNPTKHYTNS